MTNELRKACGSSSPAATALDVTNAKSVERLRAFIEKEFGRLDILVNSVCPGWVKTDMGGFFREGKPIAW